MSKHVTPEQQFDLENIIDNSNLQTTLRALANICLEKAEHIRSNWQDESLAKTWEKAAAKIDALSCHKDIIAL